MKSNKAAKESKVRPVIATTMKVLIQQSRNRPIMEEFSLVRRISRSFIGIG